MAPAILLKNGTVLVHDDNDHVQGVKADLLIEGDTIAKIEAGIEAPAGAQVIDCTDKILSPGFVDTHHHVWQTLLKGRHGNDLLLDCYPKGNFSSSIHTDEDFFWATLGGGLAMIDAGTTTVVDHAHQNYRPESSKAAIAGHVSSGIRAVFCYCPTLRITSWEPFQAAAMNMLDDWVVSTLAELAGKAPFGDGRTTIGLAFDGLFYPKEVIVNLFNSAKKMGVNLITTHYVKSALFGSPSPVELLNSYGLLDNHILFSHATNATETDAELLKSKNAHVASTPSTEMQMIGGQIAAFHPTLDITSQCGVGVDCHSNNSVSIVSEVRLLLQHSRGNYHQTFHDVGKVPKKMNRTVEEAFNLGTIGGARAAGLGDKVGSLKVGKLADVLIWDATSPAMVCASQEDAVDAVVLQSSPKDLETVIVNGVIRKQDGKLLPVDLTQGRELWANDGAKSEKLEWKDVSKELIHRRVRVDDAVKHLDLQAGYEGLIKGFYIDERVIVDKV